MSQAQGDALLRRVLSINGIVSGLTGLIVFVFAGSVDRLIGSGAPMAVRVVGGGLVLFAAAVYATAHSKGGTLGSRARTIMILDMAWVAASAAVVVAGWFNPTGNLLVVAVAAVVGLFAAGEWVGLRRLGEPFDAKTADSYSG